MNQDISPTRVRYTVVAVIALTSVLLYLDRICSSFTEGYVREDLGLDRDQMSYVLGAFFFSYALAQVPTGWLSDRFGARRMMTIYIVAWSLFTAATGLATGLVTLLAARLAFGIAQAGAYPTAAGLVRNWVPLRGRGKASSIVALGGRLGGATASALTALLLVAFTPVSTSSRLEDADLLDVPALCRQIYLLPIKPDPPVWLVSLTKRIRDRLPESAAEVVYKVQRLGSEASIGPDERTSILEGLNRILAERDLTDGVSYPPESSLPQEALRILKKPWEARTPEETERLNRLVIETAFPGTIRQLYGKSWRDVLLLYGGVGLLVGLAFWLIVRDRPGAPPWSNQAEEQRVEVSDRDATPRAGGGIPWWLLVRSGNLWLSSLTQFGVNLGWVFLITLLPRYLTEVFHVPIEERATMAMLPLVV